MLQGILVKKVLDLVLKQLFKKFDFDKINKYVTEDNELDDSMKKLKLDVHELTVRLENLENKQILTGQQNYQKKLLKF